MTKTCKNCGGWINRSIYPRSKFCNMKCRNAYNRKCKKFEEEKVELDFPTPFTKMMPQFKEKPKVVLSKQLKGFLKRASQEKPKNHSPDGSVLEKEHTKVPHLGTFNLSEKIHYLYTHGIQYKHSIPLEDVKTFIKMLKDFINREDLIDWDDFAEELDKLAGEDLKW